MNAKTVAIDLILDWLGDSSLPADLSTLILQYFQRNHLLTSLAIYDAMMRQAEPSRHLRAVLGSMNVYHTMALLASIIGRPADLVLLTTEFILRHAEDRPERTTAIIMGYIDQHHDHRLCVLIDGLRIREEGFVPVLRRALATATPDTLFDIASRLRDPTR